MKTGRRGHVTLGETLQEHERRDPGEGRRGSGLRGADDTLQRNQEAKWADLMTLRGAKGERRLWDGSGFLDWAAE